VGVAWASCTGAHLHGLLGDVVEDDVALVDDLRLGEARLRLRARARVKVTVRRSPPG
jgi:hypothetical protein